MIVGSLALQSASRELATRRSRRAKVRHKLHLDARRSGTGEEIIVHDLSPSGMLIETAARLSLFGRFQLDLPDLGNVTAVVVWSSGHFFGCQFEMTPEKSTVSAARLRSPREQAALGTHDFSRPLRDYDRWPVGVGLVVFLAASLLLWSLVLWGISSSIRWLGGLGWRGWL
jgi:hypothetical protein